MLPKNRIPPHPGEILLEEFLVPLEISQVALAEHIGVSAQRINELVRGKRGMTADTAWRLAKALKTSPELWMGLQADYDLAKDRLDETIKAIAR